MSVLFGACNWNGKPVDRYLLARTSEELSEYGPDSTSLHVEDWLALGFRGFQTDADERQLSQPKVSERGAVVALDGRLDNREQLLDELHDFLRDDQSDAAILALAFDQWHSDCFAKLVGEWAAVIWDNRNRTILLARDFIGVRQLFYYPTAMNISWCSHLKPLVVSAPHLTVSNEYVAGYLALYPDAKLTPYEQISSVPPGGFVSFSRGQKYVRLYWNPHQRRSNICATDIEYEQEYRRLFRQAVRRRLHCNRTILAELSGGLDSSSVVCMAHDLIRTKTVPAATVDTYSYYDADDPEETDFVHFTKVEEHLEKTGFHANLNSSGDSFSLDDTEFRVIPGFGNRLEVAAAFAKFNPARKYRVLLSGLGGDEMNGQSLDPRVQLADLFSRFRLSEAYRTFVSWSQILRMPWIRIALGTISNMVPSAFGSLFSSDREVEPWINPEFARTYSLVAKQNEELPGIWFWRPAKRDGAQTLQTLGRRMTYVPPPTIEHRYPFLDQDFVEFLMQVPFSQLVRPGERRSLMRRALKDLLPPTVAMRRSKAGAGRCYALTVEKHWKEIEGLLVDPYIERLGYVNKDQFRLALCRLRRGDIPFYLGRLLKALSLEVWLRSLDQRGITGRTIPLPHKAAVTQTVASTL